MWERRCPGPSSVLSFLRSFLCSHVGEEVSRAILSAIILTFFPLQSRGRGGVPGHPQCYHSYVLSFAVMWERRCPGPSSVLSFLRSFLCSHVGEEVSRAILSAIILTFFPLQSCGRGGVPGHPHRSHSYGLSGPLTHQRGDWLRRAHACHGDVGRGRFGLRSCCSVPGCHGVAGTLVSMHTISGKNADQNCYQDLAINE